jgi:nicotinamide-nucleotide amidase
MAVTLPGLGAGFGSVARATIGAVTDSEIPERQADVAPESDPLSLAGAAQAELLRCSRTLATAESLTGGRVGDVLSAAPGASETYLGGVVSYATEVKTKLLGVSAETVERHGVVSAECAAEMAAGARDLLGADYGLSTTGVAGPARQEEKPVGRVFVGAAGPGGVRTKRFDFDGDRPEIREQTMRAAIDLLVEAVRADAGEPVGGAEADGTE